MNGNTKKGVSTLIASIFVIFLIVAMVSSLVLIMNYWRKVTTDSLNKIELASQKTMESIKITQGPTVTNTQISLTIQNDGSTYVLLLKYYVRDLQTNQATYGNLNKYIPVASKAIITINGSFNPSDNYTIILISSRYKKYVFHYPPPTKPQEIKTAVLLNDHLIRSADDGTIVWAGIAKVKKLVNLTRVTHAIYYNDFNNKSSFKSNLILSGNWERVSNALEQKSTKVGDYYGGENIYLMNVSLPTSDLIFVLSKLKNLGTKRYNNYIDIVLFDKLSYNSFFVSSVDYTLSSYYGGSFLELWKYPGSSYRWYYYRNRILYKGGWTLSNYSYTSTYQLNTGEYYWMLVRIAQRSYLLSELINNKGYFIDSVSYDLKNKFIRKVGFGTFGASGLFDDALITVNAIPIYINVSGLITGERVVIVDSQGDSFSAYANSQGMASINVLTKPILRNAKISVFSPSGNLLLSSSFSILLGGDELEANYKVSDLPCLMIGSGGVSYIDVYNLTENSEGYPRIIFWKSIYTPGNIFNGSAFITYDNSVTDSLLLVNRTGIYSIDLLSEAISRLSSSCSATASGVVAEVVDDDLIVFPGEGSHELCVLNLTDLTVTSINLSDSMVDTEYGASATDGSFFYAVARNSSSGVSKLIKYEPGSNAPEIYSTNLPGYRAVGLAYGGGYLWLLLEGGSLYRIDLSTGDITHISVLGLPAPIGPGDRLVYYSGYLILVRATGSDEVWLLPTS